jgi:hypothetical protein
VLKNRQNPKLVFVYNKKAIDISPYSFNQLMVSSWILLKAVLSSLYNSPLKAKQTRLHRFKSVAPYSTLKHFKKDYRINNSLATKQFNRAAQPSTKHLNKELEKQVYKDCFKATNRINLHYLEL